MIINGFAQCVTGKRRKKIMVKKNIAKVIKKTFIENMKDLIKEIHTHRKAWSILCSGIAALTAGYGYVDVSVLFATAAGSLATWSLVLPKK
jgi:hypothetical protein